MMRLAVAVLLAACACTPPAPSVSAVEPNHGDCTRDQPLRIRGSAFGPRIEADLQSGDVGRLGASVGGVGLADLRVSGGAVIEGVLQGGLLPAGADYDVFVRTAAGNEATLVGGFHCDIPPLPDAGDTADGDAEDDVGDGEAEADGGDPIGPVVTVTERASSAIGAVTTIAWVADRWVMAWIEDDGGDGILRLGELAPGETELLGTRDIADAGRPTDPLVRAWADTVWLSWVDRSGSVDRYQFRLLDDGLGIRSPGGPLGSADSDVMWQRDHDAARDPATGRFLFVAPVAGATSLALVESDGTVTLRTQPVGLPDATPGEPRVVPAGDAFRLAWWENVTGAPKIRAAVVETDGTVRAGPTDLDLGEPVAAPVLWGDDRDDPARLFACWAAVPDATSRSARHRLLDLDFGSLGDVATLSGTGRAVRCATAGGLVAWAVASAAPSFSVGRVAADGSVSGIAERLGHGIRATPGVDVAVGPDRYGLVWIEDRPGGVPVVVRFLEVLLEP